MALLHLTWEMAWWMLGTVCVLSFLQGFLGAAWKEWRP